MAEKSGKIAKLNNGQEEGEDRFNTLSDCLLLHILSFLDTKQAARTSLLSKRWQFLWTYLSVLDLREGNFHYYGEDFVDLVGRIILMCSGIHLNKFTLELLYKPGFASKIDLWVHCLVKNKVKHITLICRPTDHEYENMYMLPQMLYSYSYLTTLTVGSCELYPTGAIKWVSLKSLCLEGVLLFEFVMENILSGCPVLEDLHLKVCSGLACLNISSLSLTTLVIEDWLCIEGLEESFLEISAPHVLDLSISECGKGRNFMLRNVPSVVRAKIDFNREGSVEEHVDPLSLMNYMKKLLESLRSVKELELGPWCIEVLSMLEVKGWQLPPCTRSCLTLTAWRDKRSIPGILCILKSHPNLETLTIRGDCPPEEIYTLDEAADYLHNDNLGLDAFHLKTININWLAGPFLVGEPMLTMMQILLNSAKVLEKMVINTAEKLFDCSQYSTSTNLRKVALQLLNFPRASPKAVIVVI